MGKYKGADYLGHPSQQYLGPGPRLLCVRIYLLVATIAEFGAKLWNVLRFEYMLDIPMNVLEQ